MAGDDLRILIARVTTACGFSLQACTQIYLGGDQDEVNMSGIDVLAQLQVSAATHWRAILSQTLKS